jgi:hypothetical protein
MMKRRVFICVTSLFTVLMGTMAVFKFVALRSKILLVYFNSIFRNNRIQQVVTWRELQHAAIDATLTKERTCSR